MDYESKFEPPSLEFKKPDLPKRMSSQQNEKKQKNAKKMTDREKCDAAWDRAFHVGDPIIDIFKPRETEEEALEKELATSENALL